MNKLIKYIVVAASLTTFSCTEKKDGSTDNNSDQKIETTTSDESGIEVVDFSKVEALMGKTDKVYVLNFFASWCKPCLAELPGFEKVNDQYSDDKVSFVYVSLDDLENKDSKLKPIVEKLNLKGEVWLLSDTDYNTWLPKVDKNWDGAIPYTLIYNDKSFKTLKGQSSEEELKESIEKLLSN